MAPGLLCDARGILQSRTAPGRTSKSCCMAWSVYMESLTTRKLRQQACRRRFNVYHAVHSTSMLPLRKVSLLLHDDAQRKAIFCSASPEAFEEEGPPLDKTDKERLISILEHRQLCVAMSSGDVYVSRRSPQALAH